jgi:putative flippase GtrA
MLLGMTLRRRPRRPLDRGGLPILLRCAGASLAGVAVELGVLAALVSLLHVFYLVGSLAAGIFYFFLNFFLNRCFVFSATRAPAGPQLLRHGFVAAGGMALGTPLLWFFVHAVRLPYPVGWALAGAIAFLGWTFPMHRRFTYRLPVLGAPASEAA